MCNIYKYICLKSASAIVGWLALNDDDEEDEDTIFITNSVGISIANKFHQIKSQQIISTVKL